MEKINSKIENLPVNTLKEMIEALFNDMRDGADLVLSAVMAILATKISEEDYVAFLDGIA